MTTATAGRHAALIQDELEASGIELVCALPDDWLVPLLARLEADDRLTYVPVARETETVGICAGAFFGGMGSVALMGIAGLFTCIHELATLSQAHGIPMFILASLRGTVDDLRTYQVAQGRYGLPVLDALQVPYTIIDDVEDLGRIRDAYVKSRLVKGPLVTFLTRRILLPE